MKKTISIIASVIIIILVIFIACNTGDKSLDIKSEEVKNLYSYLGEVNTNHCGGLNTYTNNDISKKELTDENTLCNAYYHVSKDKYAANTVKSNGVNASGEKICTIGNITLATNENSDSCEYKIIASQDINEAYQKLYGEEAKDINRFFISDKEACIKEGDKYYCGPSETFTISIAPEATIYRLIDKATKSKDKNNIYIYDYFLKVSDNKCYKSNNANDEDADCTSELKNATINNEFIKKYGAYYKHTYKKDSNNNYYWTQSGLKNKKE